MTPSPCKPEALRHLALCNILQNVVCIPCRTTLLAVLSNILRVGHKLDAGQLAMVFSDLQRHILSEVTHHSMPLFREELSKELSEASRKAVPCPVAPLSVRVVAGGDDMVDGSAVNSTKPELLKDWPLNKDQQEGVKKALGILLCRTWFQVASGGAHCNPVDSVPPLIFQYLLGVLHVGNLDARCVYCWPKCHSREPLLVFQRHGKFPDTPISAGLGSMSLKWCATL
jgi:hypothetical protein